MPPKEKASAKDGKGARQGKPPSPDYIGVENLAVTLAAMAAGEKPNQTLKETLAGGEGLRKSTGEQYAAKLDEVIGQYGWPSDLKYGRPPKIWTTEDSKAIRPQHTSNVIWGQSRKRFAHSQACQRLRAGFGYFGY